jgi:hypothetical protein
VFPELVSRASVESLKLLGEFSGHANRMNRRQSLKLHQRFLQTMGRLEVNRCAVSGDRDSQFTTSLAAFYRQEAAKIKGVSRQAGTN